MATVPSPTGTTADVNSLVIDLASANPVTRQRARESLVALGSDEVAASLIVELTDPREHVRWEAAKALAAIKAPVSAPGFVNALEDDDEGVRWLAAEGLVALGKTGLLAVLSGLIKRSGSPAFCQGAHHVLSGCTNTDNSKSIAPVLVALTGVEPGVGVPPAAYRALIDLKVEHP